MSTSSADMAPTNNTNGCDVCKDRLEDPAYHVIIGDLIKEVDQCKDSSKKLGPFLQIVNAILNAKTSQEGDDAEDFPTKICIHTEAPLLLGEFDKKVDDKLVKLLPDDTLFSENFSRYFDNEKHVIYEIKPSKRLHSTLAFFTKVPLNKGLSDPTPAQVLRLVSKRRRPEDEEPFSVQKKPITFVKGCEVKVKAMAADGGNVPFHECVSLQAKPAINPLRGRKYPDRIKKQTSHWWDEKKIGQYITAFSKLRHGGSIFLGVREAVENDRERGMFIPNGIVLNKTEQGQMRTALENKIKQGMVCYPAHGQLPTEISFHKVQNTDENEYVVEIAVRYFPGMCFYEAKGPESHEYQKGSMKSVDLKKWHEVMAAQK